MANDDTPMRARPVAVVRAGGDAVATGRWLAETRSGPSIDLRLDVAPVLPADIRRVAAGIVAEQADARARAHEQRAAQLVAAADAADAARLAADAAVEARQVERRRLLEGAAWCDDRSGVVADLGREVAAAEAAEAEAQARLAAADARLAGVTEQRAAAEGVLGEARRQLAELEVAGRGENDVRRGLEQAGQVARDTEAAAEAALAAAERCAAEVADAEARLAAATAALADLRSFAGGDPDAVAAALARLDAAPVVDPSPADLALADELAWLESATPSAEAVDPSAAEADREALAAAQVAVESARAALAASRRPVPHVVPEWWDRLARLHAEVVDAEAAVSGAFARKSTHRRLEEAVAAERALLDELGYPSHLDALMSGGRPAGQQRDAGAEAAAKSAVALAEIELAQVRARVTRADERRRIAAEVQRVREAAAARVGRPAAEVGPDDLRRPRRDPVAAAELAAALGVPATVDLDPADLADRARAWLGEHRRAAGDLAAAEAELRAATEALARRRAALEAAREATVAAEAAARDARIQVGALEAELGKRIGPVADPATRAATAAALRDRVGAVEARVATAEAAANEERAAAAAALAESTGALAGARRAVIDVAAHLADLTSLAGEVLSRTGDLDTDLAAAATALRSAADQLGADADAHAAAEAGVAAATARAALDQHLANPPGRVGDAALTEALARLLDPAQRTSDVLVEPLQAAGDDDVAQAALLEAITLAGRRRPVIVVTDDPRLLGWAIELATEVGGLVSIAAFESGPPPAEEPTGAAPAARSTDPAPAPARPTG